MIKFLGGCMLKSNSIWSIVFIILGLLSFGLNWVVEGYSELIAFIGAIFILLGALFSFVAIFKNEKGILKFLSLISFFIILFLITWYEPFQLLRIVTWLKYCLTIWCRGKQVRSSNDGLFPLLLISEVFN